VAHSYLVLITRTLLPRISFAWLPVRTPRPAALGRVSGTSVDGNWPITRPLLVTSTNPSSVRRMVAAGLLWLDSD
jgi:hypothetical protein